MKELDSQEALLATKQRLGLEDCTCPWGYTSSGRLYGVNMGKAWHRMRDAADCPAHGVTADSQEISKRFRAAQRRAQSESN